MGVCCASDVQGIEDYMGDMDFKLAGTKHGVTALQVLIQCISSVKCLIFTCDSIYAMARICHANSVRPSVRLSVTRVYCVKTAERITEILSLSDRPHHSSFSTLKVVA